VQSTTGRYRVLLAVVVVIALTVLAGAVVLWPRGELARPDRLAVQKLGGDERAIAELAQQAAPATNDRRGLLRRFFRSRPARSTSDIQPH